MMKYQINIIPDTTPCFESRFEWVVRIWAWILSFKHTFNDVGIWEYDESVAKNNLVSRPYMNPGKSIGRWRFGKYDNIDWRKDK